MDFYDKILEYVFVPDEVSKSYIAGTGFLIKYNKEAAASVAYPEKFKNLEAASTIKLYLECPTKEHYGQSYLAAQKLKLNEPFNTCSLTCDCPGPSFRGGYNQYGAIACLANTQTIPANALGCEHPPIKFDCTFSTDELTVTLYRFAFRPCKIGYNYHGRIHMSNWFLTGGNKLHEYHLEDKELLDVIEVKWRFKGITPDMVDNVITEGTFYYLNPKREISPLKRNKVNLEYFIKETL